MYPFRKADQRDPVSDFRQQAPGLVQSGNREALKHLYASTVAKAKMANPDAALEVDTHMRMALREAILAGGENVRRGIYDDL
jgi:hypothetical protein